MCNRAANERDLAHSGESDIANVLSAAVEEAIVLLAAKPRTDSSLAQSQVSDPIVAHRMHASFYFSDSSFFLL
jgi:hypothetical protein